MEFSLRATCWRLDGHFYTDNYWGRGCGYLVFLSLPLCHVKVFWLHQSIYAWSNICTTWLNDWQDPRKFITVLLSLLFATELEMGFDPTVHRIMFKGKIRYVYKLTPKGIRRDAWAAVFSNDCNNLQPSHCVHQWEEDTCMEGNSSYWHGWLRRDRWQRSCIKRRLAWQGFSDRKRESKFNLWKTATN